MKPNESENGKKFRALVWMVNQYKPSEEQLKFHASDEQWKLVAGGVRGGKSLSTAREIDQYSVINGGLGWLIGPDYDQARAEFKYLLEPYLKMGVVREGSVSMPKDGAWTFTTLDGFTWETKSSKNVVTLATAAPDVLVVCEAAQHQFEAYEKVIERATEKGAPIIFSGTFESSFGWYAEKWQEWQAVGAEGRSFSIPTWSNTNIFPGGRNDPKILKAERNMDPDLFQERYGGIPCKPKGLVFPEFDFKKHVRPVDKLFDPQLPVEIWVDPATHVYSVLFVQRQNRAIHVLDEIYAKGQIGQEVIPQVVETAWWKHSCKRGVIDVAAKQHHANRSQLEVWKDTLVELKTHAIDFAMNYMREDIWRSAIKLRLAPPGEPEPFLLFSNLLQAGVENDGGARGILGELQTYRWRVRTEGHSISNRPVKYNEDALSALGYGLVHYFGPVIQRKSQYKATVRPYWT